MVVDPFNFWEWLFGGVEGYGFVVTLGIILPFLACCGVFLCYLAASARHGPVEGFYVVARTIRDGVVDVRGLSPRRTLAIAKLAVKESLRSWTLVVIVVFLVVLLFAGWFLDTKTDHPARLYISFVLTATSLLVLLLALLLSTFSLPNDIKNKTIYTVITKPVRAVEIVAGRILGFTAIGTVLLAVMCVVSYFFVVRGLMHEHVVEAKTIVEAPADTPQGQVSYTGNTNNDDHHRHTVKIGPDGVGQTDMQRGHRHRINPPATESTAWGRPKACWRPVCRSGRLRFLTRHGQPVEAGINVGNVWTYRSYIEGATLHTAIWTFSGIEPEKFPSGLPLELTLSVFRTYKGRIDRRILGEIWVTSANPSKPLQSAKVVFESQEYSTQRIFIPRKLKTVDLDGSSREIDLFEDLVSNGRVEVWLRCAERSQFFGVAEADVYVRAADALFFVNFAKGYGSVWLQMFVVTCLGVMFSTFLSGPVAMVATLSAVVLGYYSQFVIKVQTGEIVGGGPLETVIRIFTQQNVMTELEIGLAQYPVYAVDWVIMLVVRAASSLMPDFAGFNTASYVAYGFNISASLLASHALLVLVYTLVLSTIGFFILKTREIAA